MSEVRNITLNSEEKNQIDSMLPKFRNNLSLLIRVAVKEMYENQRGNRKAEFPPEAELPDYAKQSPEDMAKTLNEATLRAANAPDKRNETWYD